MDTPDFKLAFNSNETLEIIVLGTGCQKCKMLEERTKEAVNDLGINAIVKKEEDIVKIMSYGIMSTPGLVVNNNVSLSGRLASVKEIKEILVNELSN